MKKKRAISCLLAAALAFGALPSSGGMAVSAAPSGFGQELAQRYGKPAQTNNTEVRWWLACGSHTDQTIKEEIQTLHEQGFTGVELCLLDENGVDNNIYAYGSDEWSHDVKTAITEATKYGMSVGLTSGTHWHDANIPGLDPNSDAAGQEAGWSMERLQAGATKNGPLKLPPNPSGKAMADEKIKRELIGVYAYRIQDAGASVAGKPERGEPWFDGYKNPTQGEPVVLDQASLKDLTAQVKDGNLNWKAPDDGEYILFSLWKQGTFQRESPSQKECYAINYYDKAGVTALQEYLDGYIFKDPELVETIKKGNVQFFLDSLEINNSNGTRSLYWTKDMAEKFKDKKNYDIRQYLPLFIGIGTGTCFAGAENGDDVNVQRTGFFVLDDAQGKNGKTLTWQIMNDFYDVQTQLIQSEMLTPLKQWAREKYNMGIRSQNSYGTYMECSEMTIPTDYTETETLNMKDQTDLYRLWSGGAHIMDKLYSSETGAIGSMTYALTEQDLLYMCYNQFAAGVNRVIWHGHASAWGPDGTHDETDRAGNVVQSDVPNTSWPGHHGMGAGISARLDSRQPGAMSYAQMNDHLGRTQQLLREGVSRTDLGILHIRYGETTVYMAGRADAIQDHKGYHWMDMALQDAGYTYDYFSPAYLMLDDMDYDAATGTLGKNVGYQAILLNQQALPVKYAEKLLELAKQGLKVIIVDDAATISPYADLDSGESAAALKTVMDKVKALDNVKTVAAEADAYDALLELGVRPRAELVGSNAQILTQMRQDGDKKYLFAYNYCSDKYCGLNHGRHASAEVSVDGTYIPYAIDSWNGKVEKVAGYRYEDGRTVFPVELDYMNVALYAFEPVASEELHVLSTTADKALNTDGKFSVRATKSGTYMTTLSDGTTYKTALKAPKARELKGWKLTVEDWTAGEKETRTEKRSTNVYDPDTGDFKPMDVTPTEIRYGTNKPKIEKELTDLATWDKIDGIGKNVSGIGYYSTSFNWDASAADGAFLDLGDFPQTAHVEVNGKPADPVNPTNAVIDISGLLEDGENKLDITVTTTLTNRLLQMGVIQERETVRFNDYSVHYFFNGLSSVRLVPYAEKALSDDDGGKMESAETETAKKELEAAQQKADELAKAAKELAEKADKAEAARKEAEAKAQNDAGAKAEAEARAVEAEKARAEAQAAQKAAEGAMKEAQKAQIKAENALAKAQFEAKKPSLKKVSAGKKKATVTWKKVSGANGYVVQYATKSNFKGAKKVTIKKGSTTKAAVKKLKSGKNYYFRMRAYKKIGGKTVYTSYSAPKKVKIK